MARVQGAEVVTPIEVDRFVTGLALVVLAGLAGWRHWVVCRRLRRSRRALVKTTDRLLGLLADQQEGGGS
jgi:hypothetical protein